jgi:hypothetical protein
VTYYKPLAPRIFCTDGTSLSVQASHSHYCTPREDEGPYTEVEVGFIYAPDGESRSAPRSWVGYADDGTIRSSVFGYVPIDFVRRFVKRHGGIKTGEMP